MTPCQKCGYERIEQEAARRAELDAKRADARLLNSLVCTACGHVGEPKQVTRGSLGIGMGLRLFFLIPGLIYTMWRHGSRYSACPTYGNPSMIPDNSPKGGALVKDVSEHWLCRTNTPCANARSIDCSFGGTEEKIQGRLGDGALASMKRPRGSPDRLLRATR